MAQVVHMPMAVHMPWLSLELLHPHTSMCSLPAGVSVEGKDADLGSSVQKGQVGRLADLEARGELLHLPSPESPCFPPRAALPYKCIHFPI